MDHMPAYTWAIERLDCYPERDGQADVVFAVHWRLRAQDGDYHASGYGSAGLTYDPASPFTSYSSLTQEQVVSWVQATLGADQIAQMEAALANAIAAQINPPVVSPPLPWA
jgi:hypothetical protein